MGFVSFGLKKCPLALSVFYDLEPLKGSSTCFYGLSLILDMQMFAGPESQTVPFRQVGLGRGGVKGPVGEEGLGMLRWNEKGPQRSRIGLHTWLLVSFSM